MNDEHENRKQQVTERLLQSNFGLWNALLTVNGILLAAFSAASTVLPQNGKRFVLALIFGCVLSLALLVYNFVATKLTYSLLGQRLSDENAEISEQVKIRDIAKALFRHKCISI